MQKIVAKLAIAVLVGASVSAHAQAQERPAKKKADPNEIVCEKIEVSGSRLAVKRVCQTRAEWAAQRQADRQGIEKAQVSRGSCEGCQ